MTSALLLSSLEDKADLKKGLETIFVSSKLLLTLVNNIIDLSKIESGKMGLEESCVDIHVLAQETISSCQPLASDKKIEIALKYQENVPRSVICDSLKVRQVLINLLGNAIKFTRLEGRIELSIQREEKKYSPSSKQNDDKILESPDNRLFLRFSVKDEGPGIPEDKIPDLFGRFVQLDQCTETKARYGGSGLGLHISKEFVHLMKGIIWVDKSVVGEGSVFCFSIPAIPCVDNTVSVTKAQLATSILEQRLDNVHDNWPPLKILVVEDNSINQKVIVRLLSRFGFTFEVAGNGQEALDILEYNCSFNLILMDVQMPIMDGLQAARKINEKYGAKRPKIAALTANVMKTEIAACMQAGMDYYVSKPVTAKKLYNFFSSLLKDVSKAGGIISFPAFVDPEIENSL
jgi:CheY-like chemotaxis protein